MTKSEIVVPIIVKGIVIGVLDVDCEAIDGFASEDVTGLELLVAELVKLIDWGI